MYDELIKKYPLRCQVTTPNGVKTTVISHNRKIVFIRNNTYLALGDTPVYCLDTKEYAKIL